jgi:hypothetical protein
MRPTCRLSVTTGFSRSPTDSIRPSAVSAPLTQSPIVSASGLAYLPDYPKP